MDDEAFAESLQNHDDDTSFDDRVERCFIIQDIGAIRKVTCIENGVDTKKNVYNVNLITPIGEIIQLTTWEQQAINLTNSRHTRTMDTNKKHYINDSAQTTAMEWETRASSSSQTPKISVTQLTTDSFNATPQSSYRLARLSTTML